MAKTLCGRGIDTVEGKNVGTVVVPAPWNQTRADADMIYRLMGNAIVPR